MKAQRPNLLEFFKMEQNIHSTIPIVYILRLSYYCLQCLNFVIHAHHECTILAHVLPELPMNFHSNLNKDQRLIRYTPIPIVNASALPMVACNWQCLNVSSSMNW